MKTLKWIIVTVLLSAIACQLYADNGDENPEYKNEVRFGPFQLFFQSFYISYERSFKNTGTVISQEITYFDSDSRSNKGYFALLEERFYLYESENRLTRVYISPGIKFRYKEIRDSNYDDHILSYGGQLCTGLKYWVMPRFTVDLYVGANFIISDIISERNHNYFGSDFISPGYSGIEPMINITFGFKF